MQPCPDRSLGIGFTSSALAQERAFFVDLNSKEATDLGTFGGNYSDALGITDVGQVVGYSGTADGHTRAFITGPDGIGMTDLNSLIDLPEGIVLVYAVGVSDAGQVVGKYVTDKGEIRAFITGPDGSGMADLGSVVNLPTDFTSFSATAMNNHAQLAVIGTVVPEPEAYAMLLLGLGLLGFLARGRVTA